MYFIELDIDVQTLLKGIHIALLQAKFRRVRGTGRVRHLIKFPEPVYY